jgi:hypothetical protein
MEWTSFTLASRLFPRLVGGLFVVGMLASPHTTIALFMSLVHTHAKEITAALERMVSHSVHAVAHTGHATR